MYKQFLSLLVLISFSSMLNAQVVVPGIFTDHMVLQRNALIPVWGWAQPNEKIEIRFHNQVKKAKADKSGLWSVKLDVEQAGGPYQLTIKAKNTIQIKDVWVGEVWLCSGQSNMEFPVGNMGGWQGGVQNYKAETAAANNYPLIRHIKIQHTISSQPQPDFKTSEWKVCDSTNVGEFTAVGYFFAKNSYDSLKIPIGLINDSWGGTNIETWISREGFESSNEFKEMIAGMPKIDLDSLTQLNVKGNELKIEALQGSKLKGLNPDLFKETLFDDSNWPEMNAPQLWEQQSLGDIDGVVWLRKTVNLSAADINSEALLELATIDDEDITYVNGFRVGSTSQYDASRRYKIPMGTLKEGKNVIAIRITDTGGGGGIFGNSDDVKISFSGKDVSLAGNWKFQVTSIMQSTNENAFPSLCYNAMIHPLIPYAFQGVLWYQGESNSGRSYQYRKAFPLLINDWRQKWNNPTMPFYFVQLATFNSSGNSNEGCGWAELREAQTLTLSLPYTGMCVTTDIGNPSDVHPTNKQDVGKRLAAMALNDVYNKKMVCKGPSFQSMEIIGNQVVVSFNDLGGGLTTPDKYGYVKGFELAGNDSVFYFAKAYIQGNTVVVSNENVGSPAAVRFSWMADASESNLFNKEGFPAVPFRTDQWKTVTKDVKYSIEIIK